MALKLSMSDILTQTGKLKSKKEKVAFLQENDNPAFRTVLRLIYDKEIEFLIPDTAPPWKKNNLPDATTMLYREARRLKIFIKGGGYDNLNQIKRETLFISLLEDIEDNDAKTLCTMISKKPFKGLSKKVIQEAFPDLIEG